jgi:hypothetical protein
MWCKFWNNSEVFDWAWDAVHPFVSSLLDGVYRSAILPDDSSIHRMFRGKPMSLLWRGTRDGFAASAFHNRCDGHANTLTIVLDTDGRIFGGFTPVAWESRSPLWVWGGDFALMKPDDGGSSFLFAQRNPHDHKPLIFGLQGEKRTNAIRCQADCGPAFGWDITIADHCDKNRESWMNLGRVYLNNTNPSGRTPLTYSSNFTVKEIEVFEIELPADSNPSIQP